MAVSTFAARPNRVASIDSYYPSVGGSAAAYKIGYLPRATKAAPTVAPGSYYPSVGGPAAANPMSAMVPVAPSPKPPAQTAQKLSFSIDDDPFVKAAKDAMPGVIENAQKTARSSIIARLLQFGDPTLNSVLDRGAARQMLDNLQLGKLGGQALDLLALDPETQQQIVQTYGAEPDEAVQRDIGPSGTSQRAQFDRSVAQAWHQRLRNLIGSGAVRSGDLGYQTREQQIARDVGLQNLVSSLLGEIGGDVAGVDSARQTAQKAIDDAIVNARNTYAANPEAYAAMLGISKPSPTPDTTPVVTTTPSAAVQSQLQQGLTPTQFGILQSVFGGRR